MSRTMSAGMQAIVAAGSKRLAKMLRLTLVSGDIITLTDHDQDLAFDLGSGSETYLAGYGFRSSDIAFASGMEPDTLEVTCPFSTLITLAGAMGGRFNNATVRFFEVCWDDLTAGYIPWLGGDVLETRVQGDRVIFEIGNVFSRLQQQVGVVITNSCRADHTLPIDPRCGRTPETDTATVVTATDGMAIEVSVAAGPWADGYFDKGTLVGLTGENEDVSIEIERWFEDGEVRLFGFLPVTPDVGDTFTLVRGCGKTRQDCIDRDNILQARAFFDVPGTVRVMSPAIPGQGNDE